MEKIKNTSIVNFLERENLLSTYQFGFRSGLGAADLLTALNREWLTSINTGGPIRVLAVDVAGAFGKVSQARCPSQAGIVWCRGQSLQVAHRRTFQQNTTGRCWRCYLPTLPSCCWGTPRKHHWPNPFLVYVNDAADVLPDSVYPATYADDMTLFSTLSSAESSATECQKFQMGVNNLAHWGATWKIQFEPSKSQAMVISRHRNDGAIPLVSFNGHNVNEVDTLRLLGVTFDRHLSYSLHLRSAAVRVAQRIGFLRKAFTLTMAGLLLIKASFGQYSSIAHFYGLVLQSATLSVWRRFKSVLRN